MLTQVPAGCPAAAEELFGPVASVFCADDAADAIRLANQTRYGLSASLWTRDRARGKRLARRIRAGGVFVNQMSYSDPRLPFGGIGLRCVPRSQGLDLSFAQPDDPEVSRRGARAGPHLRWVNSPLWLSDGCGLLY